MVVPVGRRFDILDRVQNKLGEVFKGAPVFITTLYANETLTVRQNPLLVVTGVPSCFRRGPCNAAKAVCVRGFGWWQRCSAAGLCAPLAWERQEVRVSASAML